MVKLTTLGTIELVNSDGHRVGSVLAQPKRLALLAVIALTAPDSVRRETLVGLLWPELGHEEARRALRQALHFLRRSLGPDVITGKGSAEIGLSSDRFFCDATALRVALREDRPREALEFYRGEPFPGFFIPSGDAPFEHWLEAQRRELKAAAAEAAWAVATADEEAGNNVAAGIAAKRAYVLSGETEQALQRVLRLYTRLGDPAAARSLYHEHEARLRREEGLQPTDRTLQLLEEATAAGRSQESAGAGGDASGSSTASRSADQTDGPTGAARRQQLVRRFIPPSLAAGVAVLVFAIWGSGEPAPASPSPAGGEIGTLHVSPIQSFSGDAAAPGSSRALSLHFASALAGPTDLDVVLAQDREVAGSPGSFRVETVLRRAADSTRLTGFILDHSSGAILHEIEAAVAADGRLQTDMRLVGELAYDIRRYLGFLSSLPQEVPAQKRRALLPQIRQAALDVAAAKPLVVSGAREAAAMHYHTADSLLAEVARADPAWVEPVLRRAELILEKIWFYLLASRRDSTAMEEQIIRGIELADHALLLDPENARAWETRGRLQSWLSLSNPGSRNESQLRRVAIRDLEKATELDPDRARAWAELSLLHERQGDFPKAYYTARRAYAADRFSSDPYEILIRLFRSAVEVGLVHEADRWCHEFPEIAGEVWLTGYCHLYVAAASGRSNADRTTYWFNYAREHLPDGRERATLERQLQLLFGVVLTNAGSLERAYEVVGPMQNPEQSEADIEEFQAWFLLAAGRPAEAAAVLRTLADTNPDYLNTLLMSKRFEQIAPEVRAALE